MLIDGGNRPVIGSFAVSRQGWRWTQWILLFFALFTTLLAVPLRETYPPIIKRTLAKQRRQKFSPRPPIWNRCHEFLRVGVTRPIHMVVTEPLVTLVCLYVAVTFGILFSFFAAIPYTFGKVYGFGIEESGLVFLCVAIGCALGLTTMLIYDTTLYRPKASCYPPHKIPPEYRLCPAMIGSIGLPVSLFWYAWTARSDVSWASSAIAALPFSLGVLCIYVSFAQFMADTYKGTVVASQSSANSMCRYTLAGAFPLCIIKSKPYRCPSRSRNLTY